VSSFLNADAEIRDYWDQNKEGEDGDSKPKRSSREVAQMKNMKDF